MQAENEKDLRDKLNRLERENEYLRYRLAALGEGFPDGDEDDPPLFSERVTLVFLMQKKHYLSYLVHRIRVSRPFRLWDRTRFAVRAFSVASKIWSLLVWIFALLGVGTQFVFFVGALLILLPAGLIMALFVGVVALFRHKTWKKTLSSVLFHSDSRPIYVLFAPNRWEDHAYFCEMISQFSRDGTVFLVCRRFSDTRFRGLFRPRAHIYALHVSFWFTLKTMLPTGSIWIY